MYVSIAVTVRVRFGFTATENPSTVDPEHLFSLMLSTVADHIDAVLLKSQELLLIVVEASKNPSVMLFIT